MFEDTLFTGRTVEEAVEEGLRTLKLREDQVNIEIVSRGSRGLFGLGSEPAQVMVRPRQAVETPSAPAPSEQDREQTLPVVESQQPVASEELNAEIRSAEGPESISDQAISTDLSHELADEELAAMAVELLSEIVRLMGFDAEVTATWHEPDDDNQESYLLLDVRGDELSPLIGRRGETLNSIQYLLRLMVNQRLHQWKNLTVDVDQYRQRHAEHLVLLAHRSAEQVVETGRALALEPMPASDRRLIHLALRDHPDVYTESLGDGERRKVRVIPKNA